MSSSFNFGVKRFNEMSSSFNFEAKRINDGAKHFNFKAKRFNDGTDQSSFGAKRFNDGVKRFNEMPFASHFPRVSGSLMLKTVRSRTGEIHGRF
jgi:hypothetical protein